jgi:hypothetical protein
LVIVTYIAPPSGSPPDGGASGTSPAPSASPAPADFSNSRSAVRVDRKGRFRFGFLAGPSLTGNVDFTSVEPISVSKRGSRKPVVLPGQPFTVPTTGVVTLKLKLSRQNLRILKLNRKIAFDVLVGLRNGAGLESTASTKLTLKAPKRPYRSG